MPDPRTNPQNFESAVAEFEALVEKMERGDLSLEDSVTAYERGVVLHGYCEQVLSEAERKVRILTGEAGEGRSSERLRPFGTETEDARGADRDEPAAAGPGAPSPPAGGAPEEDDLPF